MRRELLSLIPISLLALSCSGPDFGNPTESALMSEQRAKNVAATLPTFRTEAMKQLGEFTVEVSGTPEIDAVSKLCKMISGRAKEFYPQIVIIGTARKNCVEFIKQVLPQPTPTIIPTPRSSPSPSPSPSPYQSPNALPR